MKHPVHILPLRLNRPQEMYMNSEESSKAMDYRKNMNTPRDMIDDDMQLRLMREAEPAAAMFGGNVRRENRRRTNAGNCGCRTAGHRDAHLSDNCRSERIDNACNRNSLSECQCDNENRERRNDHIDNRNHAYGNNRHCREDYDNGNTSCDSCVKDDRMKHFRLAMAYVPFQEWEKIYEDEAALARGTLFEALDLPWYQSACGGENGNCRKCTDNR